MADYLNRSDSPLGADEWEQLDRVVVETARSILVARRVAKVVGPLGAGLQAVPSYVYAETRRGEVSLFMEADANPIKAQGRIQLALPMIFKDFVLYWRDLETSRQVGLPLDLGAAAAAAAFVAQSEDDLIFNGNSAVGQAGFTTLAGRTVLPMRDWGQPGSGFQDAVDAVQALVSHGFSGPFALVTSPLRYANMARVLDNTGVLEVEQVRKIMNGGVYHTPVLADDVAVVLSTSPQGYDIVIGQDMVTAYLGVNDLNYPFRVMESLVLRVHMPTSIVTLEGAKKR